MSESFLQKANHNFNGISVEGVDLCHVSQRLKIDLTLISMVESPRT